MGVGAFQTFSIGVPSEKDIATAGLRLVLPPEVSFVTPNVKSGWAVAMHLIPRLKFAGPAEVFPRICAMFSF
jgi:hypothetical protein